MNTEIRNAKDLSKIVRKVRKAQKLSQGDLAGMASTRRWFISDLENGKETAQPGKVLRVLDTLGVSVAARHWERLGEALGFWPDSVRCQGFLTLNDRVVGAAAVLSAELNNNPEMVSSVYEKIIAVITANQVQMTKTEDGMATPGGVNS